MDVLSWVVALVVGVAQPSFTRAALAGVATSVAIRLYQLLVADTWGSDLPEDLFGATAMLVVTVGFAWLGSVVRAAVTSRREVLR